MRHVLLIGAGSTLAGAIADELESRHQARIVTVSRDKRDSPDHWQSDYSEASLVALADECRERGFVPDLLLCCVGVLHWSGAAPEKRLADLDAGQLGHYFYVNTIVPALVLKHLSGLLPRRDPARAVFLSAKVGSIGDNFLGGWYGYRASKAALNMMIKNASIELGRRHRGLCVAALHPGTTDSPLSEPFQERIPAERLYSPRQSAERLVGMMEQLSASQTGEFFSWDGSRLPW